MKPDPVWFALHVEPELFRNACCENCHLLNPVENRLVCFCFFVAFFCYANNGGSTGNQIRRFSTFNPVVKVPVQSLEPPADVADCLIIRRLLDPFTSAEIKIFTP